MLVMFLNWEKNFFMEKNYDIFIQGEKLCFSYEKVIYEKKYNQGKFYNILFILQLFFFPIPKQLYLYTVNSMPFFQDSSARLLLLSIFWCPIHDSPLWDSRFYSTGIFVFWVSTVVFQWWFLRTLSSFCCLCHTGILDKSSGRRILGSAVLSPVSRMGLSCE